MLHVRPPRAADDNFQMDTQERTSEPEYDDAEYTTFIESVIDSEAARGKKEARDSGETESISLICDEKMPSIELGDDDA